MTPPSRVTPLVFGAGSWDWRIWRSAEVQNFPARFARRENFAILDTNFQNRSLLKGKSTWGTFRGRRAQRARKFRHFRAFRDKIYVTQILAQTAPCGWPPLCFEPIWPEGGSLTLNPPDAHFRAFQSFLGIFYFTKTTITLKNYLVCEMKRIYYLIYFRRNDVEQIVDSWYRN